MNTIGSSLLLGMVGVGSGFIDGVSGDGVGDGSGVGVGIGVGVFLDGVVFGGLLTEVVGTGLTVGSGVTGLFAEVTRVMMVMAMMEMTVRASTPYTIPFITFLLVW